MSAALDLANQNDPPFDGRHRLVERIARGAMGEVFVAHDEVLDRQVALKRMRPKAMQIGGALEHFGNEYRALCRLKHPRIIEVYDYGIQNDLPYYTMELLDGDDLRSLAPMPYREACRCLRDVASSLALLHARRLLHRDVSPRNVRRTSDGRCKLIDFGTMVPFGVPANVAGTPPCLPPEALRGRALDQRADLYALGALAYWLLTGRHARDVKAFEDLPQAWKGHLLSTRKHVPNIPEGLDDLVLSMLQIDPMGRPASASDVIEALTSHGELEREDSAEEIRSYLAGAALVGRDAAMDAIATGIDRVLTGRGGAMAIRGDAGMGKTRLLSEAVVAGRLRGLTVISVGARECTGERGLARALVTALNAAAPQVAATARQGLEADLGLLLAPLGTHTVHSSGEARTRAQRGMAEWFTRVARERPLLVAIDDLDRTDEFSCSFLASLGVASANLPILVLATVGGRSDQIQPAAIDAFVASAYRVPIDALDASQTAELMGAFFGDAPNLQRAAAWMFRNAHGNPALCGELARHLIEQGAARFRAGLWVLPDHDISVAVPGELREAVAMRFGRLPAEARELAALVAVHGGSLSESLLAAIRPGDALTQGSLARLQRNGILRRVGTTWVFGLEAMREAAELSLQPQETRQLHAQLAEALLASDTPEAEAVLLAGWHLVHTAEELRGADILARVGPRMLREGLGTVTAIRALEKALEVYERRQVPLAWRLRLAAHLMVGGLTVDPSVVLRIGQATIETLYRASGLGLAVRLSRYMGGLGLYVALAWTSITRLFVPRSRRPPPITQTLNYLCRATLGVIGVRTNGLDAPGAEAAAQLLSPLAESGIPVARETALVCRACAAHAKGREADTEAAYKFAIDALERLPERIKRGVTGGDISEMLVGLWLARGINACYRTGATALEMAKEVEAIGSQMSGACADRIRLVYYTVRGYREEADHYRRGIEVVALQGGSSWQLHAFITPVEGIAATFYGDMVVARRALERLELLVKDIPSMLPMRDLCRLTYLHGRGRHEEAVEAGRAFIESHPPRSLIGWAQAYAALARSLVELGRYDEACEISGRGLAAVPDEDREYFIMYAPLEGTHALALGMTGEEAKSTAIFASLEKRMRASAEYSSLAILGEARARMARLSSDLEGMRTAVGLVEEAARQSRNPALVASASRLAGLCNHMTSEAAPSTWPARRTAASGRRGKRRDSAAEQTIVARVLHDLGDGDQRARHALQLVAQYAGANRGYLLVPDGDGVRLAASLRRGQLQRGLERRLSDLLSEAPADTQHRMQAQMAGGYGSDSIYCAFLLPDGKGTNVGVIALEEGSEPLTEIPAELLREVGAAFA